jgi:hypothetical protein
MGRFLAASVFDEGQTGEVRLIFLGRAQKESRPERRLLHSTRLIAQSRGQHSQGDRREAMRMSEVDH